MFAHSVTTSYGETVDYKFWQTGFRPFLVFLLPMFFSLSGYLVAWSLIRVRALPRFIALRAIRIYPALAVEVVLSAFILGPMFTNLTLREYFTNNLLSAYLLNVFGDVHYYLPGLFYGNPYYPLVNAQLWTVPYELICYVLLSLLTYFGIIRYRIIAPISTIALSTSYFFIKLYRHNGDISGHPTALQGPFLVLSFLCGVTIFMYRDCIQWNRYLFVTFAAICFISGLPYFPNGSPMDYITPLPIAYCTIYLGLTNFRRIGILAHADYSYGIFLYHFAIQQAVMHALPWSHTWYFNSLISLPLTILFAAASWHWVEKPALTLRRLLEGAPKSPLRPAVKAPPGVSRLPSN